MDLSIVIVNWNTRDHLINSLNSIYANTSNITFEVIVVDNASSDGSVEIVKDRFNNVILIENKENLGFAKANNMAFPKARGRYVLLLNSDTTVMPAAFERAVQYLDRHDSIGALTPKILNSDGSVQHPCYVRDPSLVSEAFYNFCLDRIFRQFDTEPADDSAHDVKHATGACLFIRQATLEEVGFLDEKMIFSLEDTDICIRIRRKGWGIRYFPDSSIIHYGGASREKLSDKGINAMLRSRYIFYRKYHGPAYVMVLVIVFVAAAIFRMTVFGAQYLLSPSKRNSKLALIQYNSKILKWHFSASARLGEMGSA